MQSRTWLLTAIIACCGAPAAAAEGCLTSKDENDTHEPQSLWFCGFAILTLPWGVGLIAYGLYFFDEEF